MGSSVVRADGSEAFEGLMKYVVSYYDDEGVVVERSLVRVMATPERILVPDMQEIGFFAANAPRGMSSILVRNDAKDVLVYGSDVNAYWFKSYELRLLGLAMKAMPLSETPIDLDDPDFGGRFRVREFETKLWRYIGEEGFRFDLYLSDRYRVNWGLIGGSWLFGSGGLSVDGLDDFLEAGLVPVRVEVFQGSHRQMSVNLMKVEEMHIDRKAIAKPEGKILHSTKDVLAEWINW